MTEKNIAIEIINVIGPTKIGKELGVTKQSVNTWRVKQAIPTRHVFRFIKAAKQYGYNITVEDIRPDMLK